MLTGVFKDRRDAMALTAGALVDAQNIVWLSMYVFSVLLFLKA